MRRFFVWILACLILAAPGAVCADGVVDFVINRFSGYTITQSGSYRLTADVGMDDEVSDAIRVQADNVRIDLNGHTIAWVSSISGETDGIDGTNRKGVRVSNGRIVSFRGAAVRLGDGAQVSDLSIEGCNIGIEVGSSSVVSDCTVRQGILIAGSGNGILAGNGGLVRDCAVGDGQLTIGIAVGAGGTIRGCTVTNCSNPGGSFIGIYGNLSSGVRIAGCTVSGSASGNGGDCYGIRTGSYPVIEGNVVIDNAAASGADCFGIHYGTGGVVKGNTASRNSGGDGGIGHGIVSVNGFTLIEGNQCDYNFNPARSNLSSIGILAAGHSRIVGNSTTDNDASGIGTGAGIAVTSNCLVQGNNCSAQTGGTASYGIRVTGGDTVVRDNSTAVNGTAGIRLNASGNRCELNRTADTTGISDAGGNSIGAGDLANITF